MNGERIRLARRRLGLSLRDLAERMGQLVSAQAISRYEAGAMLPSSTVLIALAKALEVDIPYLLAPGGVRLKKVDFRAKADTRERERARVSAAVVSWVERYLQIEEILGLEGARWEIPRGMPERISSAEEAEALALQVREKWKLGLDPIPNMTELFEEKGIKVLVSALPERIDGLTCFASREGQDEEVPVIVINQNRPLERRRFTLAHELAHRVIAQKSTSSQKKLEAWCNRFAGAFLAPKDHLLREVGKHRSSFGYRELITLKKVYRISAAAFLMRLEQIGVIDEAKKEYAFRTYASGWRKQEPEELEDRRGEKEKPSRFERLVFRALAENMIGEMRAAELLSTSISEVERAMRGPNDANHR